jgi:hypothetical protein
MKMSFIAAALFLLSAQTASADPMKCSGENKTCVAACGKSASPQAKQCAENCRTSLANCARTGCWANGALRYCGLMKQ